MQPEFRRLSRIGLRRSNVVGRSSRWLTIAFGRLVAFSRRRRRMDGEFGVEAGASVCGLNGERVGGRAGRRVGGRAGRRAGGQAGERAGGRVVPVSAVNLGRVIVVSVLPLSAVTWSPALGRDLRRRSPRAYRTYGSPALLACRPAAGATGRPEPRWQATIQQPRGRRSGRAFGSAGRQRSVLCAAPRYRPRTTWLR